MQLTHAGNSCSKLSRAKQRVMKCTIVAMAGAGAFVDEDGHELVLCVLVGPHLQWLSPRHGQDAGHVQLQGNGELVRSLHLAQLLRSMAAG